MRQRRLGFPSVPRRLRRRSHCADDAGGQLSGSGGHILELVRKQLAQYLKRQVTPGQAAQFVLDTLRADKRRVVQAGQLRQEHVVIPAGTVSGRTLAPDDAAWVLDLWCERGRRLLIGVRPDDSRSGKVLEGPESRLRTAVERVVPVTDGRIEGTASFLRNEGGNHLAVTAAHVVLGDGLSVDGRRVLNVFTVTWAEMRAAFGRRADSWYDYRVATAASDAGPDVAVLLVEGSLDLPPATMAERLVGDEEVAAFGAFGDGRVGTTGLVLELQPGTAVVSMPTLPGWSGGPVTTPEGDVAGIVASGSRPIDEEVWTYVVAADLLGAVLGLAERKLAAASGALFP